MGSMHTVDEFMSKAVDFMERNENDLDRLEDFLGRVKETLQMDSIKEDEEQVLIHTLFKEELEYKINKLKGGKV